MKAEASRELRLEPRAPRAPLARGGSKVARAGALGPLRRFLADTRGTIAVLAAIVFPVVIGGIGLGVETSYWYMTQRKLQHAADIAAHAAGVRNRAMDSMDGIRAAATQVAIASGFLSARGTITVSKPPLTGAFAGNADAVEVVLVETSPRWFSSVFVKGPVTIGARAVSRISGGAQACILALSPVADGALTVSGSTNVILKGCNVASDSVSATSFLVSGTNAAMTTGCAYAVGQAQVTSGLTLTQCAAVRVNSPSIRDPYRDVAAPAIVGSCQNANVGTPTGSVTLTPTDSNPSGVKSMHFCSGLNIKGKVTFMPGLYIIEGGSFTVNGGDPNATANAQIIGSGVTFYLTGTTNLQLNGNVTLSLAAPTSGPFSGILFFGARDATSVSNVINGSSGSTLQGAIYTPASSISFKGDSAATGGCTQVVARLVTMTGNSTLGSDCSNAGTQTILANEGVSIVE